MGSPLTYSVPAPDDSFEQASSLGGLGYSVPAPDDPSQGRHWIGKTADTVKKWGLVLGPGAAPTVGLAWLLTRKTEQPAQQREAHGVLDAALAGSQGSATSLLATGRLPDVVLNSHHAKWYERLAYTAAQTVNDLPLMGVSGGVAALAAAETGPLGAAVAGGAAAFGVPTAIRSALTQAYSRGDVTSVADFLDRTRIVFGDAAKDAVVGGVTGGVGSVAARSVTPFADQLIAKGVSAPIAQRMAKLPTMGAEVATMTTASALLDGRIPEPQEFIDGAVLIGGLHGAQRVAGRLLSVYSKTGVRPIEVMSDIKADPTIAEDLVKPPPETQAFMEFVPAGTQGFADSRGVKVAFTPEGKPSYIDTRNTGVLLHGTSRPFEELGNGIDYYNPKNIYGQGFYTTDAFDVAKGYTRKGRGGEPTVYEVTPKLGFTWRMVNMELPLEAYEPKVRAAVEETLRHTPFDPPKPGESLREVYDRVRDQSEGERYSTNDVQELFFGIQESLMDMGYRGLTHEGGKFTGAPDHKVSIFWFPGEDLDTRKVDWSEFQKKPDVKPIEAKSEFSYSASKGQPEIPRAYRPLAATVAAAEAFPGNKAQAQAVLDHPFADIPETKQPHQLNLKYIEGPEDLKALQIRMSDVYREEIDAARGGTQGWAETEAKAARQVADMTGRDLAKVMAGRQPGDTANAVQLKIQGDILMQATVEAGAAIKAVKDAGLDATDAMRADALAAIHKAAMIQADFTGASAELGRALQYLQRIKDLRAQGEGIAKLVDMYGNDPRALLEMASAIDTPEGLAKFARKATKATTWEKIVEAWKAGLVSGPITQLANIMGNTSFAALRPAVDAVAAAFSLGSSAVDRVRPVEPLARIMGDLEGVRAGLKAARVALVEDSPGGKAEHQHAIQGKTGYAIRTPFRLLSAGDALFRVMIEHGEAYALAARQAAKEGLNPATREFRERVAEIAQNPTEAMIDQIEHAGTRFTFNAPLGEKGRAVQQFVRSWHLQWAVPFISTPGNVFKEMARLTPAAPLVGEWRADFEAGGPRRAKALAEVALGTGVSALTMAAALAGHITGSGDPDPNKRRVQMASGWQPYSVKIGNTWYSYQRLQPVGTLLGLAADVAEVWEHMTPDESDKVPKILATAFANAVTNQTFLLGMSQVVDALSDPDRKGARFAQNVLASTVPAAVGQTAQITDPYQREIQSILDAVKARIPGVRESLMPKRDPFGEPIASQERVAGVTPLATTDVSGDRVRTEAARLAALPGGLSVAPAPKSISLPSGGTGLGTVDLTPEQRDVFAETSGKLAYQALSPIVNSPAWNYMSDFERVMVYREVFSAMNQVGKAAALTEEQRQTKVHEILQGVVEKLKPTVLSPE